MPCGVKAYLPVATIRREPILLQQKISVDEAGLRRIRKRLWNQLAPVPITNVHFDRLVRVIVAEVEAGTISADRAVVDYLIGRLQPNPGPRPRRAPDVLRYPVRQDQRRVR